MKKKQKNKKQPQQPAMNDEICFYSLVLYLLRLYKFIFDMLTFLFIFDMLTFFRFLRRNKLSNVSWRIIEGLPILKL